VALRVLFERLSQGAITENTEARGAPFARPQQGNRRDDVTHPFLGCEAAYEGETKRAAHIAVAIRFDLRNVQP
jgi:hypothetical protein